MRIEKETTAPIPSVAPDGEQPSALARTDSITDIEETHKQFGKIQAVTMPELMETRFRIRPAVIDGLLPVGTYLLAGAPKIGKSFLVLQMAYQVSMGEPFLGFPSRQGTVLYLALEDTCERLQKRLAQMTEQDSEHLILSVFSETLDEGLTERLSDFWSEHTDAVLIIIDTLQRVRGRTPDNGSYAADYDTLARLKEFSDTYGVTVLVVHHTRKEGAEDVFNMISGTNGLMGAADGALLLHKDKRTASDAVLELVGRDQPQLRLHLRFAAAHLCWELLEVETERYREPPCPLLEVLSRLVNKGNPSWNGTATELAQCLSQMESSQGFTPNWIVRTLNAQQENLLREYGVRYVSYRTKEGKALSLRWDGVR
jgi:RecA-family ATPase